MVCVEEIVGDNLVVVVGSVGKCAAAVAITQCPDPGHIGPQLVVNGDVSVLIAGNPGLVETQIVCIGDASHREKNIRTEYLRCTFLTVHMDADTSFMLS